MSIVKDRRIGRFYISLNLINEMGASCRALFANCIVLKAEMQPHTDSIEYWAICDSFAELPEHQSAVAVPFYRPELKAYYDEAGKVTSVELVSWGAGLY